MAVDDEHPLGPFAFAREPDTGSAIFRWDKRAIQERDGPVQLTHAIQLLQRGSPNALPDTLLAPVFEPSPHRRRSAIVAGQILPARAGDEDVHDAFDGLAVISSWPPSTSRRRKEWPDERPLALSQMNAAHTSRLIQLSSVSEPPVVLRDGAKECLSDLRTVYSINVLALSARAFMATWLVKGWQPRWSLLSVPPSFAQF